MRVLVDTSVWSLFLRRQKPRPLAAAERRLVMHMRGLITDGLTVLTGPVRQELLSGIGDAGVFDRLSGYLRHFDDETPDVDDHEQAARFDNRCRSAGVATSPVDMLLCALSHGRRLQILTIDRDFERYAKHLPIRLAPHP